MVNSSATIRAALSDSKIVSELPQAFQDYALERCLEAAPYLEMIPDVFGEYTDHGVNHSCTILALADKLLAQNRLNHLEKLIFVLAAFYHDIGMSCSSDGLVKLEEETKYQHEYKYLEEVGLSTARLIDDNPQTVKTQIKIEYLRRHHGERGESWILRNFTPENPCSLVDDVYAWDVVATVCIGHTLDVEEVGSNKYPRSRPVAPLKSIDVRFLTCLLRLADICHLSRDRALPHVRKSINFKSLLSKDIWEATGDISGPDCDESRAVIVVAARPRSFERHRMISRFVSEIQAELQNAHRLLADRGESYQFPWKFVDDTEVRAPTSADYIFEPNARFQLVYDKIVHLLMGSKLYADPLYALRECIQNAVDAIRVFRVKNRYVAGRLVLHYRQASCEPAALDIFDNGTGMDREICLRHLLSVGSRPFASSERRYREWGDGNIPLIAQHGIGFLSCFMLADRVEVFSNYKGAERVHLVLDSPTSLGEFKKTQESEFPQWNCAALKEPTPWEESHGTCVRLHLKEEISKINLMHFLAENILRVGERIIVIYEDEAAELREIWGQTDEAIDRISENLTLAEVREKFSSKREPRGLGAPPHDPSQEENLQTDNDIRGIVKLRHDQYLNSRLSQDGFLIRDGAVSLFGAEGTRDAYDFPFYFDLDVQRARCFELDTERARIIDRNGTATAALIDWIEERGLQSLGAVESSLFFPCGNLYYHRGSDLFTDDHQMEVKFHEALRKWYSPERMRQVLERGRFEAFARARLYTTIHRDRDDSVSINDLSDRQFFVLVPRVKFGPDVSEEKGKRAAGMLLDDIAKAVSLDRVIFLPGFPESFSLPLSIAFNFEWLDVSSLGLLGRLMKKTALTVPSCDLIEQKLKEAGGFLKAKPLAQAISASGEHRRPRGKSSRSSDDG